MDEKKTRGHLAEMLDEFAAHIPFDRAVEGFPPERAGERVDGLDHSMWMLVEHMRIANRDMIDWVEDEEYESRPFPKGYWPPSPEPPDRELWDASVAAVKAGLDVLKGWLADEERDLTAPLEREASHSALREILLVIAHNGYHIGQIVDLRSLLGTPVKDY
jgi:uncharacterized damage-inducible protein DinB